MALKDHPELNERWVQERIAEDPALLGLGDLVLKDKERISHAPGGSICCFKTPIRINGMKSRCSWGKSDEGPIIRTIEYWDIEKETLPPMQHTAVIVAEDITTRFLNVIALFNGSIPLVAIQMNTVKIGEQVSLIFATVIGVSLGWDWLTKTRRTHDVTDRPYWEKRGSKGTVGIADELLEIIKKLDPGLELKYNKFYIGLAKNDKPNNFDVFRGKMDLLLVEPRLERSEVMEKHMEEAGLVLLDYYSRWGRYRIRLSKEDAKKHETFLTNGTEASLRGDLDR